MTVHPSPTVRARRAARDTPDQDAIALLEARDTGARFVHDADAFVPKGRAGEAGGDVAFEDVCVGATDRGVDELDDCIGGIADFWDRLVLKTDLAGAFVDEGFHGHRDGLGWQLGLVG